MNSMATLTGIARRAQKGAPMETLDAGPVTCDSGVAGDFRGKPGKRQVTVLSAESWQIACHEVGDALAWTTRRANLLVSGLSFSPDQVGSKIQIGELVMQITGETDPCSNIEKTKTGLFDALKPDWRGGVCCKVIQDGRIALGDPVLLL
jgi:MOSC domain-containing protein YiiM